MVVENINIGVILDAGSWQGKIIQNCISMAISDFYTLHAHYRTRIRLHKRDSKGQPLRVLSAAIDLLKNSKVEAIIGAQSSMEANFLAELGNKASIPMISFEALRVSDSFNRYPYLLQITQDEVSQVKGIFAVLDSFKWKNVILIYEDSDDWKHLIPFMVEYFHENKISVEYKSIIATSFEQDQIIEELYMLQSCQSTVFIVHTSEFLLHHIHLNAKRLGMMSEGYAWIMTAKTMDSLQLTDPKLVKSMQGVIGLKSYVPASEELKNLTSRWRRSFVIEEPDMEVMQLNTFGVWAYDVAWSLAKAVERTRHKIPQTNKQDDTRLNLMELENIGTSVYGSFLLKEILQSRTKGLSGEFQFMNGKKISDIFEIVNVIGRWERRVGVWTNSIGKIRRELSPSDNRRLLTSSTSTDNFEAIIWPGGSATTPKGLKRRLNSRKLRIAVPMNRGFPELVKAEHDLRTNTTIFTGFCIDVFRAAIDSLPYEVDYELVHVTSADGEDNLNYNDVINQVYCQDYDGAIGDLTFTANRSSYVDFTLPYTDVGVGMIAAKDSKNMWIFLRPLTIDLWLSTAAFFVLTGLIVWLIERPINAEFQGSVSQQIGIIFWFSFSTLVFAHRERLESNLSKFVVAVWVFVVLILTSSYTATLTSMMTVQQIQLDSKVNYIGYQKNSLPLTYGVISNLNFRNPNLQPLGSPEEYAEALSRGSSNGGVTAIIDEIPYIKIFLGRYSAGYAMIGSKSTTNGFSFAFSKGSTLVADLSQAIARLRAEEKLIMLENAWFKAQSDITFGDTTPNAVDRLSFAKFSGLFLITGISSALALAMFFIFLLHRNWHLLKKFDLNLLILRWIWSLKKYLSTLIIFRLGETNVIHPNSDSDV